MYILSLFRRNTAVQMNNTKVYYRRIVELSWAKVVLAQ